MNKDEAFSFACKLEKQAKIICVEVLDCTKSFSRKPTNKTLNWFLEHQYNKPWHITLIKRQNYMVKNEYYEFCISTMVFNEPIYFLYMLFDLETVENI